MEPAAHATAAGEEINHVAQMLAQDALPSDCCVRYGATPTTWWKRSAPPTCRIGTIGSLVKSSQVKSVDGSGYWRHVRW